MLHTLQEKYRRAFRKLSALESVWNAREDNVSEKLPQVVHYGKGKYS